MEQEEDQEFESDFVASLLRREGAKAIVDALQGCRCYRDDPDAPDTILACDQASLRLAIRTPTGRERVVALADVYVVSTDGRLAAAVESLTSEADRADAEMRRRVFAFGIAKRIEADDLVALSNGIAALVEGVPPQTDRQRTLGLARKYGDARTVLRFTEAWRAFGEAQSLGDVAIQHVACLRELDRTRDALAATDILQSTDHGLPLSAQSVLFTQRAALWMDLFEIANDAALLARARQSAARSWAIRPSEECSLVYKRLAKLERSELD